MTTPLQTQYTSLTERRMHFGRLFWQSVAFHIAGVMVAIYLINDTALLRPAIIGVFAAIGLATWLIAFIAYRLQSLEAVYEHHLAAIEAHWLETGETGIQRSPVSKPFSSRLMVVAALGLTGFVFVPLGFVWPLAELSGQ